MNYSIFNTEYVICHQVVTLTDKGVTGCTRNAQGDRAILLLPTLLKCSGLMRQHFSL
jgi:hypothetical protein